MSELQTKCSCHQPLGYDDNKIVLLARDPHWLYAYWEISETKKNSFKTEFGEGLWDRSIPAIKIINVSKNTSNTIRVNDFSDSWFIKVDDANAIYVAELGRVVANQFFVNLTCSNYVSTPSNSISANTGAYFVDYKDLRNGRLDLESGQIYETFEIQTDINTKLGLSSAELFNENLTQHLGISSFRSDK
jgi:hypothetical protein